MCGIVGIYSEAPIAAEIYDSLIHLQHRGQDAAGILTCRERFYVKHGLGLVRDIFSKETITQLSGNIGIGHTRYPTAGGYNMADVQPLWIGSPRGIALAHNGNLLNYKELATTLTQIKHRHLNSSIDSEVLLHLLAEGLDSQNQTDFFSTLCDSISSIFQTVSGSYSVVSVIIGKGLVAFRDPHGIRPLVMGERINKQGKKDYIFASEDSMFYALGFSAMGDVQPGEVVFVDQAGKLFRKKVVQKRFLPCLFEYVYFARPDSTLNSTNVYNSRLAMGKKLAERWKTLYPDVIPDVVIPTPFTANTAALSFAHELGIRYAEGIYKNPFIGRTFIMPDSQQRSRNVRYKLTPHHSEIDQKKVLILDDSIVRGTTSREIVKMIREFGAKEIYFVSTCPPIKHPCFYGIDMPLRDELIAAHHSEEEIKNYLGVDKLLYQQITDLTLAAQTTNASPKEFCMACMNGNYVTEMDEEKIQSLSRSRQEDFQPL